MAHSLESAKKPPTHQAAAPWALLWLGAIAGSAWVPLLLSEKLPGRWNPSAGAGPIPTQLPEQKIPIRATPIPWIAAKPADSSPTPTGSLFLNQGETPRPPNPLAAVILSSASAESPQGMAPLRPAPLSGALLLGGPLGLDSLKEKPMVPAARLEQALRARSADRLEVVPPHWRPAMRALLNGPERVLPAEVVRVPAFHLKAPEEYPMAVKPDGVAETTVTPPSRSRETLERWAQRQPPSPEGSVRPVLVVLEPLAAEKEVAQGAEAMVPSARNVTAPENPDISTPEKK